MPCDKNVFPLKLFVSVLLLHGIIEHFWLAACGRDFSSHDIRSLSFRLHVQMWAASVRRFTVIHTGFANEIPQSH
jgi:hypothetical protein